MKNAKCKLTSKCLAAFSFDLLYLFSYSSAILSALPCQVRYKLAFQSQTPRAESPDQTFLWEFVLKQLGKSEQNKQFCMKSSRSHPSSHLKCGSVHPLGDFSGATSTQMSWATNPGWTRRVCSHSQQAGKQLPSSPLPTGTQHCRDNSTNALLSAFSPEGTQQTEV